MTANDTRARAIEAGARALHGNFEWVPDEVNRHVAAAVVDAVEPIISAAVRMEHVPAAGIRAKIEAEVRERLRAQVEAAMPTAREDFGGPYTALEWVLDLLDGPR